MCAFWENPGIICRTGFKKETRPRMCKPMVVRGGSQLYFVYTAEGEQKYY